ncbi:hypothetical protein GCM10010182_43540 [Actinomadura cremea]|nr:hypothetical protein GCM10010182_43540 [Actinomadura cremea]
MWPTVTAVPSHSAKCGIRRTPSFPEPRNAPSGTYFSFVSDDCARRNVGSAGKGTSADMLSAMRAADVVSATVSGQNGIGRLRERRDDGPDEWISAARMRILMPG